MNALFTGLLLLFIGLKLANIIDWSWWWVTAPFWIPLLFAIVVGVLAVIAKWMETPKERAARTLREYAKALTRRT